MKANLSSRAKLFGAVARSSVAPRNRSLVQCFSTNNRCNEEEKRPDFRSQLFASTTARVAREKAQQRKFAEERSKTEGQSVTGQIFRL